MARSALTDIKTDLISDSGAVLWSFVQGEQVEFPVTLNFLTNAGIGYTYEAVIMEGNNIAPTGGSATWEVGVDPAISTIVPTATRALGINNSLVVRVPRDRGNWEPTGEYTREDVVLDNTIYYKLKTGVDYLSSTPPQDDTAFWEEYEPNKVYIQFPGTMTLAQTVPVTATTGIPGKFTLAGHPFKEGNPVVFTGSMPTEVTANTVYYVSASGLTTDDFRVATTVGGTPLTLSTVGASIMATLPAWSVQPTITVPVYGFFELRVTEPYGSIYPRTWKPMRGLIQYLYSPTQAVI